MSHVSQSGSAAAPLSLSVISSKMTRYPFPICEHTDAFNRIARCEACETFGPAPRIVKFGEANEPLGALTVDEADNHVLGPAVLVTEIVRSVLLCLSTLTPSFTPRTPM